MNLSAPISYPEDTTEMQRIESEEFREMLTTCNLAAALNRDKPNTATRNAQRLQAHVRTVQRRAITQDSLWCFIAGFADGLHC